MIEKKKKPYKKFTIGICNINKFENKSMRMFAFGY